MFLTRIRHKRTFSAVWLLSLVFWLCGVAYLRHERSTQERLQLAGQIHAQEVAWQAVTTAHRTAMQAYFDSYIMQPDVAAILQAAQVDNRERQNIERVRLYRRLAPVYEQLRQRDVRQLHFHTPGNRSFLRFHSPHNSGDSLVASRPSVVEVNRTRKPVFGFETGRVIIGFRNVLPIIWQGQHLGSVELSQPFEAVRKGLHDLDPAKDYLLLLKASILLPKLFDEHKKHYAPSLFSQEWLVEDPRRELPDSSPPLSPASQKVYQRIKDDKTFSRLLAAGNPGAVAISLDGRMYQVSLIPLHDTDGVSSAVMLTFSQAPELEGLYSSYRANLLLFSMMVLFGGTALYLFLSSMQTVLEQEQRLALITSNIADGVYVMDKEGRITFSNHRATEILGFTQQELSGTIAHDLFHRHDGANHTLLEECPIYQVIQTRGRYEGEEQFINKAGSLLTVQVASQPMLKGGRVVGSVTVFRDITEQKLLEEQLRLMSVTDPLTGVYNRRFLQETLLKELYRAERHGDPFSLIMLDLDHFKRINDSYGHEAGDRVLRHVVTLIQKRIRSSDCLARWGGEEFMLLLPHTPLAAANALAETLLLDLREAEVSGIGRVSASFGVTTGQPGDTVERLEQRADALMYAAKQAGRNCVRSGAA
ncbi:MAG: diguanylate cyclase [Geobacteraceae bacterium]|nr:diguanylate cyclase [Geobacteraceae bacterium]